MGVSIPKSPAIWKILNPPAHWKMFGVMVGEGLTRDTTPVRDRLAADSPAQIWRIRDWIGLGGLGDMEQDARRLFFRVELIGQSIHGITPRSRRYCTCNRSPILNQTTHIKKVLAIQEIL
jgi:hypothetical protein